MNAVVPRRVTRLRRRLADQGGMSVVEMVTAVTLMVIVGIAAGSTIVSTMQATSALEDESAALDELRVAMAQLEREFRSAECVREPLPVNPGDPTSSGTLRFTTRSNGGSYEVTYSVDTGTLIRTRDGVDKVISDGLVEPDTTFTYTETPRRSIDVAFVVEGDDDDRRRLTTTVAGRNAWRTC